MPQPDSSSPDRSVPKGSQSEPTIGPASSPKNQSVSVFWSVVVGFCFAATRLIIGLGVLYLRPIADRYVMEDITPATYVAALFAGIGGTIGWRLFVTRQPSIGLGASVGLLVAILSYLGVAAWGFFGGLGGGHGLAEAVQVALFFLMFGGVYTGLLVVPGLVVVGIVLGGLQRRAEKAEGTSAQES